MKSLIFLLGMFSAIVLTLNGNFDTTITRYFQVTDPDKVYKDGKEYVVSYDFVMKPSELKSSIPVVEVNTSSTLSDTTDLNRSNKILSAK